MRRRFVIFLISLALVLSNVMSASAYSPGTARVTVTDYLGGTVCQVVAPNTCNFNMTITFNWYHFLLDDASGSDDSYMSLIGSNNANLFNSRSWSVNYHGTPAPTCTYTDTSTRWQITCTATENRIISVQLNGIPIYNVTNDRGKGGIKQLGGTITTASFAYTTQ